MTPPARAGPEPSDPGRHVGPTPLADLGHALEVGERALLEDGDLHASRASFELAGRLALAAGDAEGLGRAALGLSGLWVHEHRTAAGRTRVEAWQRRARDQLDPDSLLALRLDVRLAAEDDYLHGTSARVLAALDRVRARGDPVVLAESLSLVHHCLLAPQHADERLHIAEELLGIAGITGRRVDELLGLLWRTVDLLLVGDPHAGRSRRELRQALVGRPMMAVQFVLDAIDVMYAIRGGDLEEAERLAVVSADRGRTTGDLDALGWYAAQVITIRWFQGRLNELTPLLTDLVHSPTLADPDDSFFAALAVAAAQAGDRAEAVTALRRLSGGRLAQLPPSSTWLVTLIGVAEAAHLLNDADLAAEVYSLLEPYADLPAMASLAVLCFGSVDQALGYCALTRGDRRMAATHFAAAVTANEALSHRPALAMSRRFLAAVTTADAATPLALHRDGRRWLVELAGRSAHVDDSVGMRYLAELVASPGQDISAAAMAGVPEGHGQVEVLDPAARRAYQARVEQLQRELTEADMTGDQRRSARAAAEMNWINAELVRVTGLSGRSRRFLDESERARTSVQKAIRRAIDRIRNADPWIAEQIEADLVTGTRCMYRRHS